MSYKEQVNEFLQYCREENKKGNRLVMGKDLNVYSIPTIRTRLIKFFKPKQR